MTYLIAVVFLFAAWTKVKAKQYEHALTRVFLAMVYFHIGVTAINIEQARELSRWFVLLLGIIECFSWIVVRWKHGSNQ